MISGRHTRAAIIAKFPVYLDAIMRSVEGVVDGKSKLERDERQRKEEKRKEEKENESKGERTATRTTESGLRRDGNNGNTCKYCDRPSYCARTV